MKYPNITRASFVDRPNRFVTHVMIDDYLETVHVRRFDAALQLAGEMI